MIFALHFLGSLASKVSYYSGSIKTVRDLIDHSLDEEPPSKYPGGRVELMPLSDSMTVKDVSFRYNPSLPNSLSDISIDLAQGTYTVFCGESGSGKSTLLNLLMRFREPNEGSIEWDGTKHLQHVFGKLSRTSGRDVSEDHDIPDDDSRQYSLWVA